MDACKRNIIERMGGSSYFDVIVYQMCERILEDSRLHKYFGKCHLDDLFDMQRVVMDLAIRDFGDEETKQKVYDRVVLQHYRLFQLGLDVKHFDILKSHLFASLQDAWCDADAMEDLLDLYESLRTMLYRNGGHFTMSAENEDHDSEFFELPLKTAKSRKSSRAEGASQEPEAEQTRGNTMLKGIRQLSGGNLLSMLKLNRVKRPNKRSSCSTAPQ